MTLVDQLNYAIEIAVTAHEGQTDKAGLPYILHPLRVAGRLNDIKDQIVGVLHDVPEDCPMYPLTWFMEQPFDPEIVAALEAITKREGEDYTDYLERVRANEIASRVKIADLTDNSNLTRIPDPGPEDSARRNKYAAALVFLGVE